DAIHILTDVYYSFLFYCYGTHRDLHSFPTRRSSDLAPILHANNISTATATLAQRHTTVLTWGRCICWITQLVPMAAISRPCSFGSHASSSFPPPLFTRVTTMVNSGASTLNRTVASTAARIGIFC